MDPFLDADDIADVVVASLLDDRHIGQLYELTGPRLLTLTEVAETLSSAIGREVTFVSMSKEAYAADISQQGFPGEVATHIADVIASGPRRPQRLRDPGCRESLGAAGSRLHRLRPRCRSRWRVGPSRRRRSV